MVLSLLARVIVLIVAAAVAKSPIFIFIFILQKNKPEYVNFMPKCICVKSLIHVLMYVVLIYNCVHVYLYLHMRVFKQVCESILYKIYVSVSLE